MKSLILVFFGILSLAYSDQYVPFPPRYDGFSVGTPGAPFVLEAFYDLMCPGSKASSKVMSQVLNAINFNSNPNFQFILHIFPLPYHINAHYAAIGARVIANLSADTDDFWQYIENIFNNQDALSDTMLNTTAQVVSMITQFGLEGINSVEQSKFLAGMNDSSLDQLARLGWKYGATRRVAATPTYLANGVMIDNSYSFQYGDWIHFLNQFGIVPFDVEVPNPTKTINMRKYKDIISLVQLKLKRSNNRLNNEI